MYLDITNTYFEKDFATEGRLPQKGVSKDHKTEPIVQQGLLLDSNGRPRLLMPCLDGHWSLPLSQKPSLTAQGFL